MQYSSVSLVAALQCTLFAALPRPIKSEKRMSSWSAAIQAMQLLYDELLESLPANRLRRSLNLKVNQDYATSEVSQPT